MRRIDALQLFQKPFLTLLLAFAPLWLLAQPGLVVNEISQGSTQAREYAELVVVGDPCSTVDLRGWIFDDNNGEFVDCAGPNNGALSGTGIAAGHIRFSMDPIWQEVPVGTIILVYAFDPFDPGAQAEIGSLTPDFTDVNCDFVRVVPINASNTFMEMDINTPHSPETSTPCPANRTCPNGTTGDPSYAPANYIPLNDQSFSGFGRLGMRNSGDAFQVRQPNGNFFHGLSYGSTDDGCTVAPDYDGGPDGMHILTSGGNTAYQFVNSTNDDFRNISNYSALTASTFQSPGQPNSCANAQWIASLRRPPELVFETAGGGCNNNLQDPPQTICVGEQITFSFPFMGGVCTSDSYEWTVTGSGGVTILSGTNGTSFTVEGTNPGTVDIIVTATIDNSLLYSQGGCSGPMFPESLDYTFPLTISSGPTANTANLTACDNGNGQATFDLTSLDNTVNGGSGLPVTWYSDAQGNFPIATPSAFTSPATIVYAQVTDGPCLSPLVNIILNIEPNASAMGTQVIGCDQGNGQGLFDLTSVENIINLGTGDPVSFWQDPAATIPINNPSSYQSPTAIIYATVDNGTCPSQPVAINLFVAPQPNPNNSFITVDPPQGCGPTNVTVTFTVPGQGVYEVELAYGNSTSGYNIYSSGGVTPGFSTNFLINETTEFTLVSVGLENNPNCETVFQSPITITVPIVNQPDLSLLSSPTICAGEEINLNDYVTDLNGTGIPITFHTALPPTPGNQVGPLVSPIMDITFFASADGGGGCDDTVGIPVTISPAGTPVLGTASLCDNEGLFDLTTLEDPNYPNGTWSGTGVSGTDFDPSGQSGSITLTFSPDGGCATDATTTITVDAAATPVLGSDQICETDGLYDLTTLQDPNYPNGTWSGNGVSGTDFDPTGQSGSVTLTFTSSEACVAVATTTIDVTENLSPSLGTDDICETAAPYNLSGLEDSNIPDGTWSGPGVSGSTFDPDGQSGTVTLTFTPDNVCFSAATTDINVFTTPTVSNLSFDCDPTNTTYTVSFDIAGGNGGPYTVNGNPVIGNNFVSAAINSGDPYSFSVDDGNACGPVLQEGSFDCLCATDAGTIDINQGPVYVCEGSSFSVGAFFNNNENLDPDDILQFVLHDNAGPSLGNILATSPNGDFTYPAGANLNQSYYVSPIAGTDDGNGDVDLNDGCLSVASGIEVIFYQLLFSSNSGIEICPEGCFEWEVQFSGIPTFTLNYEIQTSSMAFQEQLVSTDSTIIVEICPEDYGASGEILQIELIDLKDANCTVGLQQQISVDVLAVPETTLDLTLCPGESIIVNNNTYDENNPAGEEILEGASFNGCDSIITVDLSFHPEATANLDLTLCPGEGIVINGTTYDEGNPAGVEILPAGSINGCDSTINVIVDFFQPAEGDLITTLCEGESITVNGTVYDSNNPTGSEILSGASANGCDSTLNVIVDFFPAASGDLMQTLCEGESITVNGNTYDESNPMGTEILGGASANGCDSTLNVMLEFLPVPTATLDSELCSGSSIIVNGNTYDESNPSGTEILVGGAANGCDSILTIDLTFNQAVSSDIDSQLCPGETLDVNGNIYDQTNPSGQETIVGGSYLGCDSIINVNLSFFAEAEGMLDLELCEGESIVVNGNTYDETNPTGTEIFPGAATSGCDSTLQVSVNFLPSPQGNLNLDLCEGESVIVNGTTYDETNPSGTEILTGAAANGCDSLLMVEVSFLPAGMSDLNPEICPGESIVINGTTYDETNPAGTEILVGAAANGCDSILNVQLTLIPEAMSDLSLELCEGESVVVNGTTYDETNPSGSEILMGASYLGCDSTINVALSFLPPGEGDFNSTLCPGENIVINGTTYDGDNPTGTEIFPGAAANGCDSLLNVAIDFAMPAVGDLVLELCEGESIFINGTLYDENNPSGTELFPGGSAMGCDSTLSISLSFLPNSQETIDLTLNPGESITVNGVVYDVDNPSGMEFLPGASANGCDSTIIVNLSFNVDNASLQGLPPTCFGGDNGTIIIDSLPLAEAPYLVSVDGLAFGEFDFFPIQIDGLVSGPYDINVIDGNGDLFVYDIDIPAGQVLSLEAGDDIEVVLGESTELSPQASFFADSIVWNPSLYLECDTCLFTDVIEPLETIEYQLIAFDSAGCAVEDFITVRVLNETKIYIPNIFSPNGDGLNDEFVVYAGPEVAVIRSLQIFDRWGDMVYQATDIPPNDPKLGWDGYHKGKLMNPGVFVYYFEVEFIDGNREIFKGDLTLLR
ncbi:MAG: gliding motility-associated C-terminal domain-containing protein [Bacteroidetes bacterium]|nr:gliding motility-associated C-terminal domain-containing protein [Bacteroidota bacterium]